MEGWIKIHRKLLEKPIWRQSTTEQKVILITLLLMANHQPQKWEWKGTQFECKAGQFITSLDNIAQNAGKSISTQNVRTALKRFEKLDFLTNESTKQGRLITVVNWGFYQDLDTEPNIDDNKDLTKTQQRPNKGLTSNKNVKNDKNVRMKEGKDTTSSGTSAEREAKYPYKAIIDYLNTAADTSYRCSSKDTQKRIKARMDEGFTFDDFCKVIDTKTTEWGREPQNGERDMRPFIRPYTLFGTKFESYLNQGPPKHGGAEGKDEWEGFMNDCRGI